jgi:DNA polymerase III subunit epsilon
MPLSRRKAVFQEKDLPIYYDWPSVPTRLMTEATLKESGKRLTPLQRPAAIVQIQRHRRNRQYLLYDVTETIEHHPMTDRQKAALHKVRARNACRQCGASFLVLSPEGYCETCQEGVTVRQKARLEAVHWAQALTQEPFLVLDTETTGLGVVDRIVEIAVISEIGDVLMNSLVNPEMSIPSDVISIHGITNEMVRGQPTFRELLPELELLLAGKPVVVYNVDFDKRFLSRSGLNVGKYRFQCAMLMYAQFWGQWSEYYRSWKRQRLEKACAYCNIQYTDMHRAVADCEATRELVLYMAHAEE